MTGRRRAERRTSTRAHFVVATDDQRTGYDRREFLRRMSDLAAEIEALQEVNERERIITELLVKLAQRGVVV